MIHTDDINKIWDAVRPLQEKVKELEAEVVDLKSKGFKAPVTSTSTASSQKSK